MDIQNLYTINIGIIGDTSVGKSTLLNAIFTHKYSEMKKLRTTMVPQIYFETKNAKKCLDEFTILKKNNESNSKNQNIKYIKPIKHNVPKISDIFNFKKSILKIHDFPGINDGENHEIYSNYFKKQINIFDCIIFVINIESSFNTGSEKQLLDTLVDNVENNTSILFLINKCDDMTFKEGSLYFDDNKEYEEMFKVCEKVIQTKIKSSKKNIKYKISKISAEDAYIYRMYKKNPNVKLDDNHLNRFGSNEIGKRKFMKKSESEKRKLVNKLMKDVDIKEQMEQMKNCGFYSFEIILNSFLLEENLFIEKLYKYIEKKDNLSDEDVELYLQTIYNILDDFSKSFDIDKIYENNKLKNIIQSKFASLLKKYTIKKWPSSKSLEDIIQNCNLNLRIIFLNNQSINDKKIINNHLINYILPLRKIKNIINDNGESIHHQLLKNNESDILKNMHVLQHLYTHYTSLDIKKVHNHLNNKILLSNSFVDYKHNDLIKYINYTKEHYYNDEMIRLLMKTLVNKYSLSNKIVFKISQIYCNIKLFEKIEYEYPQYYTEIFKLIKYNKLILGYISNNLFEKNFKSFKTDFEENNEYSDLETYIEEGKTIEIILYNLLVNTSDI